MNKKHYSYSERLAIELMPNDSHTIKKIENEIKSSSYNIIKEINKHITLTF